MLPVSQIQKKIKKMISKKRFQHTLAVAKIAKELASCHNVDPIKAYLAGILHDAAKEFSDKDILKLMENDAKIKKFPNVRTMHGVAAAHYAEQTFGVTDKEILDAISMHVIPNKKCSQLSMIIYLADKLEPSRTKYQNLDRKALLLLAKINLKKAFKKVKKQIRR
ncbi:MAG: bis(5'-nucleosyl)-tetraphosphatase (symmetrical) YqeK [Mycoplasmataceae bacterium]|jgi:nicotinate-nucleotide adenylyltransferase|nr:bis(5'-nucleosyl)-tetraphosphatase (symmetrical) YqeK [Mycoplasmataceae bacterium]